MKFLGMMLVTASFLIGSYLAVLDDRSMDWFYFLPTMAFGIIGVALLRLHKVRGRESAQVVEQNLQVLDEKLRAILTLIGTLNEDKENIDVYDLPEAIDREIMGPVNAFVEVREAIAHRHGLQAYADVMSPFSAGERYLNRVWSSAADGYIREAHEYLEKSETQFGTAQEIFARFGAQEESPPAS